MNEIEPEASIEGTPFTYRQALQQGVGGPLAVPTPIQLENIIRQAHALWPVYNMLGGFSITSWLRTPEHNKSVGGAPKSSHLVGLATDFQPIHMTAAEAKQKIQATGIYPGGGEIDTTNWVHLDLIHTKWFYARTPK